MICDDTESMRRLVSAVLVPEGYELREASNAEEALEELARARPDLVILDVHMPGKSGLAVLDTIRGDPALAATRVLLVSGTLDALDSRWANEVGADAHLSKPFVLGTFKETVRALLDPSG